MVSLLVNCIILPWLLVFSLRRMRPWWIPCSCLKMWCRTRGEDGDKDKIRGLGVSACVWMHVRYIQSLLLSTSYPAVVGIQPYSPHNDLKQRTGLGCFKSSCRVTDVTGLDVKDVALKLVLKIDLFLDWKAAPDQQRAILQPAELSVYNLTKRRFFFFLPKM